jgi:hypothetical protein
LRLPWHSVYPFLSKNHVGHSPTYPDRRWITEYCACRGIACIHSSRSRSILRHACSPCAAGIRTGSACGATFDMPPAILEFLAEGPGTGFLHKKRVPPHLLSPVFPPAPVGSRSISCHCPDNIPRHHAGLLQAGAHQHYESIKQLGSFG